MLTLMFASWLGKLFPTAKAKLMREHKKPSEVLGNPSDWDHS